MELNICDLLDDLHDVNVDIEAHTTASESRIKELTMKKIHKNRETGGNVRGVDFFGKLLVAALLIVALAIPVLAISGIHFTDWLDGILPGEESREVDYETDLQIGSLSQTWQVSGWVLEISAEDSSATGLTLLCRELDHPDRTGTLTTNEGYWLEKWDGNAYVPMAGATPEGSLLPISPGEAYTWSINWEDAFGSLDSGAYRIGKTFIHTAGDGKQEQLTCYAKFRIFSNDMEPLVQKYEEAYEELHDRDNYHLTWTYYDPEADAYSHHFTTDVWKDGENYLKIVRYYNADGTLKSHKGMLLRDGKCYNLRWEDGDVNGKITECESIDYADISSFDLWYTFLRMRPSTLGEIREDENTIRFIEYHEWIESDDSPYRDFDYIDMAYTFDDSGKITHIQYTCKNSPDPVESEKYVYMTLEVFDTSRDSISQMIADQNIG